MAQNFKTILTHLKEAVYIHTAVVRNIQNFGFWVYLLHSYTIIHIYDKVFQFTSQ